MIFHERVIGISLKNCGTASYELVPFVAEQLICKLVRVISH